MDNSEVIYKQRDWFVSFGSWFEIKQNQSNKTKYETHNMNSPVQFIFTIILI